MFGENSSLALDIGSKFIKMVYGKVTKKGVYIVSCGTCPTPADAFTNGSIVDRSSIVTALSEMLSSKNIKPKRVILGLKGSDIIIRHIDMPIMPPKQIRQAVKLEIQQYLPMDLNQYIVDSKIIDKVDMKDKKAYNVLLVAAPKKKIEDYMDITQKLGLKLMAVDLFSNSIARFFQNHAAESSKNVCVLDMGYGSSTITLIEKGKLFLEKEIEIGLKAIDNTLEKEYANTFEDIFRDKKVGLSTYNSEDNIDDPAYYYAMNNTRQVIDKLAGSMERIFNFYYTSGINKRIDCIYVYGGGSRISDITEYISNATSIDTRVLGYDLIPNIINVSEDFKNNLHMYANCISLLIRKE